ncbi:methenyltetrahydrofolate cyclohydrolase [Aureimonas altamirensis DSM 21988]|uniref:Bifunctional protein FolD n=2 Tax=Aureimonas altamirensis TaxID=370622 RepID=A0A0P0YVW8_9HYPH|nr:bifunctional methylenetetrahydrofolate dehydrogenase/methenyltetrahydrofolate cyclohydrolase FolD [Aureimonas altamirensis]BAT25604.1 bifunctional 5,10-methylene-tetrahydrofolate dehydrogenase/ 5,10-methylene-tetrahydrofolate cyclohydrolase [Aureimonas altamirensis]SHI41351.1 methenyltetrahydrofolate cyclohydrolase [Aureimonas altamirensis DSM 21988]
MQAKLIDGKAEAANVRAAVAERAAAFSARHGRKPGLAVVLVGNDPASEVYVASKVRLTREAGMESFEHRLPADTAQDDLLALVRRLNADDAVDGILVQLPLPAPLDAGPVILAIDPAKDVDGLHPENAGRLVAGLPGLVPCTPMGAMHLARTVRPRMDGLNAVVIGRSNLVGKPVAQLLLNANATVTMAHSRTQDLAGLCRTADILVAAVGRPGMVRGDWIKPGATVIDVGINRLPPADGQAKGRLVGDVAFDEAVAVAGAITPVPGGVGPMTIAFLLQNTLTAAERRADVMR